MIVRTPKEVMDAVVQARGAIEAASETSNLSIEGAEMAEAFLDCAAPDDDDNIDMGEHLIAACRLIVALTEGDWV